MNTNYILRPRKSQMTRWIDKTKKKKMTTQQKFNFSTPSRHNGWRLRKEWKIKIGNVCLFWCVFTAQERWPRSLCTLQPWPLGDFSSWPRRQCHIQSRPRAVYLHCVLGEWRRPRRVGRRRNRFFAQHVISVRNKKNIKSSRPIGETVLCNTCRSVRVVRKKVTGFLSLVLCFSTQITFTFFQWHLFALPHTHPRYSVQRYCHREPSSYAALQCYSL